jgi:hypothetical protein
MIEGADHQSQRMEVQGIPEIVLCRFNYRER